MKPGEVTDVQGTPMVLNLCVVCQTVLPEPISSKKRVYDRAKTAKMTLASNAELKEHRKISGHFCRYL